MDLNTTTKDALATGIPLIAVLPNDALWFILIPVALVAAWLARAAKMIKEDHGWPAIRKDFFVSLMLGASVGLFALVLIHYLKLDYVWGMVAAWTLAFGGVPAISLIYTRGLSALTWGYEHYLTDAAKGRERQNAHLMLLENSENARLMLLENIKLDLHQTAEGVDDDPVN